MEDIFSDYQNKFISGDSKLKDEYASRRDANPAWVVCKDITIRQLINDILDEFEEAGFDLENLPIENVIDRFASFEPKIKIPVDFLQLQEAKIMIEDQIASTEESDLTADAISSMKSALDAVNEAIKGYK